MRQTFKGGRIMAMLLCACMALGLFGCTGKEAPRTEPEVIDGGTTDRTDKNAPKKIESGTLTGFHAGMYLGARWNAQEGHFFDFSIKKDDSGVLTASERETGVSLPADDALLDALQRVIEEYDLVSRNGVWSVTAGLPPECQAYGFEAYYDSGEKLTFMTNNEPMARWAEAVCDVFADWFAAHGQTALLPPQETSPVTRLDLRWTEDGVWYSWSGVNVQPENAVDGETYLLCRDVYDPAGTRSEDSVYRLFPEDYYATLGQILLKYDAVTRYEQSYYDYEAGNNGNHDRGYFGFGPGAGGEEDAEDDGVELYVVFESGNRMSIETKKPSELEALRPMLEELRAYLESLF